MFCDPSCWWMTTRRGDVDWTEAYFWWDFRVKMAAGFFGEC